jgi:hypothetical protein
MSDDKRYAVAIRAEANGDAEVWVRLRIEPSALAAQAWVTRWLTEVEWVSAWTAWASPPADGGVR